MIKGKSIKNNMQKGITLIALVVTIVVLLILAGVSINLVVGDNGIIKKAHDAKHKHELGANKEQEDMEKLIKMADKAEKKNKNLPVLDAGMFHICSLKGLRECKYLDFVSVDKLPDGNDLMPLNKDRTVLLKIETKKDEIEKEYTHAYVYGVGGVRAPEDSSQLFAYFSCKFNFKDFDTSHVKNMSSMFWGYYGREGLDLSYFDTSNVENMSGMFRELNIKDGKLDLRGFDTSKVTNMVSMFENSNIKHLTLNSFDTSNVISMGNMFRYCTQLEELDVSNFNVQKLENANFMFEGLFKVKVVDLSNWELGEKFFQGTGLNANSDEDIYYKTIFPKNGYIEPNPCGYFSIYKYPDKFDRKMFENQKLNDYDITFEFDSKIENKDKLIPLNNEKTIFLEKDDTNKKAIVHGIYGVGLPEDCNGLFKGYTGKINLFGLKIIDKTDLSHLFEDVKGIIKLPKYIYTNKTKNMSYMCNNCEKLEEIKFAGDFDNNINLDNIFKDIKNLKSISFKFCRFKTNTDIKIKIPNSDVNNMYIEIPYGWEYIKGIDEIILKKK